MPPIGAVQGDCQWLWWMVDIPTVSPLVMCTHNALHLWGVSHSIFGSANQKAGDTANYGKMSHIPLTVLLPPGQDCKAVYYSM